MATRSAIWKSIADTLAAEIAEGHYAPGDRLPTEAQLSARFGVNRHTVRHALQTLADLGTVHARRGSGVYVTARPTDYPLSRRTRFHENVLASGRTPSRRLNRLETRACDGEEAAAMRLNPGDPVHVVEGISLVDDQPIAVFRSLFPASRLPGLLEHLNALPSVTAALAAVGVGDYTRAETRLTAVAATPTLALHLRLAEGAPLLRSRALNHDPAGQVVEFGTTWWAGDRVTLTVSPDPHLPVTDPSP